LNLKPPLFSDRLQRRHRHIAAGDGSCFLRVGFEEIALLQRFDSIVIGRRCDVVVIRAVLNFHHAI
jgi:hypothetical protein